MHCIQTLITAATLTVALLSSAFAHAEDAGESEQTVRFAVINTSGTNTLDALSYSGGSWFSKVRMSYVAFLVDHPKGRFLFDTGLGRNIKQQYQADMPLWMRPTFKYDPVTPVRDQLEANHQTLPNQIILSHTHWDHASGVADFPNAEVWALPEEHAYIAEGNVMQSQFANPDLRWHEYTLTDTPWRNYKKSLDLYGDGSVVLVDQGGHTPGSVGLYLRTSSGSEYLLCGDTLWRARALESAAPKSWVARWLVDDDTAATQERVNQLAEFSRRYPDVVIVPAHDTEVLDQLGYFPSWLE